MQQGYIKLYRKITHNVIFNNFQLYRLWSLCLLNASYKEREILLDGQLVKVMPGQWVVGRFALFDAYNNGLSPKDKVKEPKTPYRWLEKLETLGYVSLQKTNRFTVVNIVNWRSYQSDGQENDQQTDQQMTIRNDGLVPISDHQNDQQEHSVTNGSEGEIEISDQQTDQQMTIRNVNPDHKQEGIKKVKNKDMSIQQAEQFESWWNLYGKKEGKKKCQDKFIKLLKEYDFQIIEEGTKRYLRYRNQLKKSGEFVPNQKNPLTFLNGEHFNDEFETTQVVNRPPNNNNFDFNRGED